MSIRIVLALLLLNPIARCLRTQLWHLEADSVLPTNSSGLHAKSDKCDFCPEGQADSAECKDMFTAWLLCVSVYNALVPGVPADLALCCPCMTKRFFFSGTSDLTAMGQTEIQEIMQETPSNAMIKARQFRKSGAIRVYKETCQKTFTAGDKLLPEAREAISNTVRTVARATGIKNIKKEAEKGVQDMLKKSSRDSMCAAMEAVHPEFAYLWAEEVFLDSCPILIPYTVEVKLAKPDSPGLKTPTLPLHREQLDTLYKFVKQPEVFGQVIEQDPITAGRHLADVFAKASLGTHAMFGENGHVDLNKVLLPDGESLLAKLRLEPRASLGELLDVLQRRHSKAPKEPVNEQKDLLDHLSVLRLLKSALDNRTESSRTLLSVLDPLGLLPLATDEELLGLRLAGYEAPGQAEANHAFYTVGSSTMFASLFGFSSAAATVWLTSMTAGAAAGASIGTVTLPVVGTVGLGIAGAIVGAGSGLVIGAADALAKRKSAGTLILKGWRVVAGNRLLGPDVLPRSDDGLQQLFEQHLTQSCFFGERRAGHPFPTSESAKGSGRLSPLSQKPATRSFWTELAFAAGAVRELHFEQDDLGEADFLRDPLGSRRKTRRQWLAATARRLSRPDEGARIMDRVRKKIPMRRSSSTPNFGDDKTPSFSNATDTSPRWGDMPDECWTAGIGASLKKLWDFVLGTNGRGLICTGVSKFLKVGVGGARNLIMDPFNTLGRWVGAARAPTFWYEDQYRNKFSVTGKRALELLKLALTTHSPATAGAERYMVPTNHHNGKASKSAQSIPIYSALVEKTDGKVIRGPRIGTASPGESFTFTSVVFDADDGLYLRIEDGWLAPCRYLKKRFGAFGARINKAVTTRRKCARQFEASETLLNYYVESLRVLGSEDPRIQP